MHKDGEKIVFSISIMVSNTIDTIEKCMKSIEPILQQVPSELVIVDTGGTDGSIEIAKKYADKVVKFEWCKDFAKARNAGLEQCSGEWFMFMDDDEWFEDTTEMIEFFNNGEYKEYRCASYVIRNYSDFAGKNWNDVRSVRMTQVEKNTRFENSIHEELLPTYYPEKVFEIFAHHYGYVFATEEDRRKHGLRNISLLQEVVAKKPRDYRMHVQMAQEYRAIKEYQMSEEYSIKVLHGIKAFDKLSDYDKRLLGWLVNNIVVLEMQKRDYEKAFKYASDFIVFPWINTITKSNLAFRLVELSYKLEKYEETIKYERIYWESYIKLKDDLQLRRQEVVLEQEECIKPVSVTFAIVISIRSLLRLQKMEEISSYVNELTRLEAFDRNIEDVEDLLKYVLWKKDGCYTKKVFEYLFENKQLVGILQKTMDSDMWSHGEKEYLIDGVAGIETEADEVLQYRIASAYKNAENESVRELLDTLFEKTENLFAVISPVWEIIRDMHLDIGTYIEGVSLKEWVGQVNIFKSEATSEKIDMVEAVVRNVKQSSVKTDTLRMRCIEKKMSAESVQERDLEELIFMGREYAETVYSVYLNFYKEDSFYNEYYYFMPRECRFAVKLKELLEHDMTDMEEATLIKEATSEYPEMAPYCKAYVLKIKEKLNAPTKEQQEFQKLAEMIKEKIYGFIHQGNFAVAEQTLEQLAMLVPGDEEIDTIREMIAMQSAE